MYSKKFKVVEEKLDVSERIELNHSVNVILMAHYSPWPSIRAGGSPR